MICEKCHGNHYRFQEDGSVEPCPDCIGGVSSCCDGAVPDEEDVRARERLAKR